MQTFLPYADFRKSLECLDNRRLGKQRVEAYQILRTLTGVSDGWKNHPVVKQWFWYVDALRLYMNTAIEVWVHRGFENNMKLELVRLSDGRVIYLLEQDISCDVMLPPFVGNKAFHASHRSNLLRKDPVFYGQYGWKEPPTLTYVWWGL